MAYLIFCWICIRKHSKAEPERAHSKERKNKVKISAVSSSKQKAADKGDLHWPVLMHWMVHALASSCIGFVQLTVMNPVTG